MCTPTEYTVVVDDQAVRKIFIITKHCTIVLFVFVSLIFCLANAFEETVLEKTRTFTNVT